MSGELIGHEVQSDGKAERPGAGYIPNRSVADLLVYIVGIALLISFGWFVVFLLQNLDMPEGEWTRAMVLFAGVGGITFAAVGFYFGTQVQRGRIEAAKREADAAVRFSGALDETVRAEQRAARMLAEAVISSMAGDELTRQQAQLLASARTLLKGWEA